MTLRYVRQSNYNSFDEVLGSKNSCVRFYFVGGTYFTCLILGESIGRIQLRISFKSGK